MGEAESERNTPFRPGQPTKKNQNEANNNFVIGREYALACINEHTLFFAEIACGRGHDGAAVEHDFQSCAKRLADIVFTHKRRRLLTGSRFSRPLRTGLRGEVMGIPI